MKRKLASIILAGGKGTRMKSKKNKLVHKILGKEVIKFPVEASILVGVDKIIVVAGPHNIKDLKKALSGYEEVEFVIQGKPLGTAHAVWQAEEKLKDYNGTVFILVGDSPYITKKILEDLYGFHKKEKADITILTSEFDNPPPYGRIIRDEKGFIKRIVEEIDATEEEKKIKEVSASYYAIEWQKIEGLLHKIKLNPRKGEYYLTDIVELAYESSLKTVAFKIDEPILTKGINSRADLSEANEYFSKKNIESLEKNGVTFIGKETIFVEFDVEIGRDSIIFPFTYIGSGTKIGAECEIGPFVYLRNTEIKNNTKISLAKIDH